MVTLEAKQESTKDLKQEEPRSLGEAKQAPPKGNKTIGHKGGIQGLRREQ